MLFLRFECHVILRFYFKNLCKKLTEKNRRNHMMFVVDLDARLSNGTCEILENPKMLVFDVC